REELIGVNTPQGPQQTPVTLRDRKIRRVVQKKLPSLRGVAPESFLIYSSATSFEDSPLVGEHARERRSDLVKVGWDKDTIWGIPAAGVGDTEQESEEDARRRDVMADDSADEATKAMQEIDYYDLLVKVD